MGFYVAEPEYRSAQLPPLVGPVVRLGVCTVDAWAAVILVASRDRNVELVWVLDAQDQAPVPAEELCEECGWHVVRFQVRLPYTEVAQAVSYSVKDASSSHCVYGTISVPGKHQAWNLVAYSCYDQRRGVGERLWRELSDRASSGVRPVHVILGAGDQLYNDNLWNLKPLKDWLDMSLEQKLQFEPSDELKAKIADFYLHSYLRHIHFHAAAQFLRSTPQVNTWDDHDTFDGWGSYPEDLMSCAMFTAIFQESQRFYLLFQQATTPALAAADGFVVIPGAATGQWASYHFATQLGYQLGVVAPDTRSQRSIEQILSPPATTAVIRQVTSFAASTRHVIFVSAPPLLYPSLGVLESLLQFFAHKSTTNILFKTGLYDKIYNGFGEPDLLDDVTDHWSARSHTDERAMLLLLLKQAAKENRIRITFIAGDVHMGALTWAASSGVAGRLQALDPGFMPHIITSALGNKPPVDKVVGYLDYCTRQGKKLAPGLRLYVASLFKDIETSTGSHRFNNRQNFCELELRQHATVDVPVLHFALTFLAGDKLYGDEVGDVLEANIPPLMDGKTSTADAAALGIGKGMIKRKPCFGCLACFACCKCCR